MANKHLSRREFLLRVGAAGAVGTGAASLLAACGGGESGSTTTPPSPVPAPDVAAATVCEDLTGLTPEEIAMRQEQLKYVDVAADPEKLCSLCALYVPAAEGASCGTCTLVKGPIAPGGTCISFAPKQTA